MKTYFKEKFPNFSNWKAWTFEEKGASYLIGMFVVIGLVLSLFA